MKSDLKFLVPLSISVVLLNSLAIFVTISTRAERRKSTTLTLVSLMVSDILVGAVVIPMRIIEILLLQSAAFPYIYAYILFVAVFNVAFLAWDRYASIARPLWRRQIGNGKMITILLMSWAVPALISFLPFCWTHSPRYQETMKKIYRYFLVAILLTTVVTVVMLQLFVMHRLYIFWRSNKRGKQQVLTRASKHGSADHSFKRKLTSTILVISVTMSTVATWLPTIILNFRPEWITTWVAKLSLYSFFINSLVDPSLILLFNFRLFMRARRQRGRKWGNTARSNGFPQTEVIKLRSVSR